MLISLSSRSTRLTLLLVGLLAFAASAMFAAGSQAETPDRRAEFEQPKARRGRLMPTGFGGLNATEAQHAQQLLDEGKGLEERERYGAALSVYKRLTKKYPRSAAAPEAFYRSARIYQKLGKDARAYEAFDVVIRAYPNFGRFNELVSEQYRIAYDLIKGKHGRFLWLFPGFTNRDKGIEYFERLVFNAPYSDFAPLALMNVANEYVRSDRTEQAIDALDRLITNYPNSIVAPDGYLRLGQVHEKLVAGPLYDQGSTEDAITSYEDFIILFPKDGNVGSAEQGLSRMKEMLAQSRIKIADFYFFKRSRYQAARVFYNEAITAAPTSQAAQTARERLAKLEVDEARAEAQRAAQAEKEPSKFFRVFRRAPAPQPPVPATPGSVVPSTSGPAATTPEAGTITPTP